MGLGMYLQTSVLASESTGLAVRVHWQDPSTMRAVESGGSVGTAYLNHHATRRTQYTLQTAVLLHGVSVCHFSWSAECRRCFAAVHPVLANDAKVFR